MAADRLRQLGDALSWQRPPAALDIGQVRLTNAHLLGELALRQLGGLPRLNKSFSDSVHYRNMATLQKIVKSRLILSAGDDIIRSKAEKT